MIHQLKTFDDKILVELRIVDYGTEFFTSNELSSLKEKISVANTEHGLQFEKDFTSLNGIKVENINKTFTEISEKWELKYIKHMAIDTSQNDTPIRHQNAIKNTFPNIVKKWEDTKILNNSNKPNMVELMESDASKLLKEEFNQLDDLNDYLRMLADMDKIGLRRKIVLLEGYINKIKKNKQVK